MVETNFLTELAATLYGDDPYRKPDIYLSEYGRLFEPLRLLPIRLLELGVYQGASMIIWEKYFPLATIVGLDTEAKPASFPTNKRFYFVQGAQDNAVLLDQAIALAGAPFDIIIDDCSHLGCHTARSFAQLFTKGLRPGGIYIIEDICTAFTSGGGWDAAPFNPPEIGLPGMPQVFPSHQNGMVGLIKQLLDHSQAPTAAGAYTDYPIERLTVMTNFAVFHKAEET
jgi:SAM-dependent methyltransferase